MIISMNDIFTLHDIHHYLEEECTHLFIDIDNTLIEPLHGIGSVQWEQHLLKELIKEGFSLKEAGHRSSHLWKALQSVISHRLIENEIPDLLKQVQEKNILITPITARSDDMVEVTLNHLHLLGLTFDEEKTHTLLEVNGHLLTLSHGILFCNGYNKGEVIKAYLKHIRSKATKVVLVDDSVENLENAKKALQEEVVGFIGLRYAFLDQKVRAYAPDPVTDLIHKLFSNKKALTFLSKALFGN